MHIHTGMYDEVLCVGIPPYECLLSSWPHTWRVDEVGQVEVQLLDGHSDVVRLDAQARVGALW